MAVRADLPGADIYRMEQWKPVGKVHCWRGFDKAAKMDDCGLLAYSIEKGRTEMKSNRPRTASFVAMLIAATAIACAPAVQTQKQRLEYINKVGREGLQKSMSCDEVKLDFRTTEHAGIDWYDLYMAEGCGYQSDYVTKVSQQSFGSSTVTDWKASLGAPEAEYQSAAEAQLKKTAGFDLACKELEFTTLQALIGRMRNSWEAAIGVTGCGKKATYRTRCALQGLKAGQHDIVCLSQSNGGSAAQ